MQIGKTEIIKSIRLKDNSNINAENSKDNESNSKEKNDFDLNVIKTFNDNYNNLNIKETNLEPIEESKNEPNKEKGKKSAKNFLRNLIENLKDENIEKEKNDLLVSILANKSSKNSTLTENQIILKEGIAEKDKNKFLLSSNNNIHTEFQAKKNLIYKKIDNSLAKFEIGIFCKILWACWFFLIYPITIMILCLILELFSGLISILLGCLLLLSIIGLPVFLIFYCTTKDSSTKEFFFLLISLSWVSLLIILKGVFKITKGVFLAVFLFFKSFYLICNGNINHINSFNDNIRVGLGNLKMRRVDELNKLFNNKRTKTLVDL